MRYSLILPILMLPVMLPACAKFGAGGNISVPKVAAQAPTDLVPGDKVEVSEILPDESEMRPVGTGLHGPAQTIAGLGDPSRPGLWIETPLVQIAGPGRVRLVSGGGAVPVRMIPAPGTASAGSRLSLEAMRQLGAPLTELVEVEITPAS